MSKWFGIVGYGMTEETRPGVSELKIVERPYYGEIIRNTKTNNQGEGLNDNIELQNDFSIIADAFAYENFSLIRYVKYMGARWKIKSVDVEHPRLILSVGGVYNGPTPVPSEETGGNTRS